MPSFKLTYFPARGAAELTRYILAYGGVEYDDNRIKGPEWGPLKPKSPLGSLPILTLEDGSEYSQSSAMARYFANKVGITGSTPEERLHADMIVDLVRSDMMPLVVKYHFEKDPEQKKVHAETAKEKFDQWLTKVEEKYVKGEGSILASGFSWADLAIFNLVNDFMQIIGMELDTKFVKLHQVVKTVGDEPKIKAWVASRPVTEM